MTYRGQLRQLWRVPVEPIAESQGEDLRPIAEGSYGDDRVRISLGSRSLFVEYISVARHRTVEVTFERLVEICRPPSGEKRVPGASGEL